MSDKFIDVKKIFHDKNPRLAGLLPGFALNYVKKIIHEDELNEFIRQNKHKHGFDFVDAIVDGFKLNVQFEGIDNIPATGGFVMAANHPLGGFDGMVLLQVVSQKRRDLKLIVNDILLRLKNLEELFIGVNKHGINAHHNLEAIDKLYASGNGVIIFPAGLVSRKQGDVIKDLEWKKSFVAKAKKYNRTIIPVHIQGANTNRFYNLANWRKKLFIKANIEMFLLVDEMFKQRNKIIKIKIGGPIPPSVFDKSKNDLQWAQWVKEKVYNI